MGKFSILIIALLLALTSSAQNNNCADVEALVSGVEATNLTTVGMDSEAGELDNPAMGCAAGGESTVWYSYTAVDNENISINFTNENIPGGATPSINVLDACLDGTVLFEENTYGTFDDICVLAGTTIFIQIATCDNETGEFHLTLNSTTSANFDPCLLAGGFDLTGGASFNHSNVCAGPGSVFAECPAVDSEQAVYYTFTVTAPDYGYNILIQRDLAGTPLNGPVTIGLSEIDSDFCPPNNTYIEADCQDIDASFDLTCLDPGTYMIQISTSTVGAGDFIITSTPLSNNSACAQSANSDDCINAEVIPWAVTCEEYSVNGCNIDACPEDFDYDGCSYSTESVIWYSFTITANTTTVDITNFQGGGSYLSIFEGIDCTSPPTAISDCLFPGADELNINVDPANTLNYYIAVGSTTAGGENFSFDLTVNEPPDNDDPCPGNLNDVEDLSGGGSHNGTTCCAIGFADDNTADYPNSECGGATEDGAVWYMYTWDDASDGVLIEVNGSSISGPTTVEILIGDADAGCTGNWTFEQAVCEPLPASIELAGCMEVGEVIWVKVASSDDNCGSFSISMTPANKDCQVAETCDDLAGPQMEPVTDPNFENIDYVCVSGCLQYACPEDPAPDGCAFGDNPTVWVQIETDDIAAQLFTTVEASGTWTPMWSVYYGDPDCSNLVNAASGETPPCSLDDTSPDLHQTGVEEDLNGDPITTYYVAISADPNGPPIDDPSFTVCAATIINVLVCLGDIDDNCNADPTVEIEPTDREFADGELDPDGDGLPGPFCPGEEVEIHLEFFYDATESGADWFHGIVPTFGNGWDMENYDYDGNAPDGADMWFDENGSCAPTIQENVPHLCTYVDENGALQLCNSLCESCPDCPQSGMVEGDPLPSGYFWLSTGGGAGCANDCSPGEAWGIGSTTSQINWDFTLTVKDFPDEETCLMSNDLQLSFQTFSDGGAGCWEDPVGECLIDRKQLGANWKVECEIPPGVIATPNPQEICTGEMVGVDVATDDGSGETIYIDTGDNPNPDVSGYNDHVFPGGSGTIDDILINTTSTPQTVIYYAHVEIPGNSCPGPIEEIEVIVYPDIIVDFTPQNICYNDFVTVTPTVTGGKPPYTYVWQDGSTGPSITEQITEDKTYCVTVTGVLCQGENCVDITVSPEFTATIEPDPFSICQSEGGISIITAQTEGGVEPFNYNWNLPNGVVSNNGFSNQELEIDVAACDINPFGWDVEVGITDAFNCFTSYTTKVFINDGPIVVAIPDAPTCTVTGDAISINVTSTAGTSAGSVQDVFIYDCNGDEIAVGFGSPYNYSFFAEDCEEYTIVVHDINGCTTTEMVNITLGDVNEPVFSVNSPEICVGETATVTLVNASDYTGHVWNDGTTGNSISVVSTVDGILDFSVIASNGPCDIDGDTSIIVNPLPIINWSGSTSFCAGSSTTLDAGGDDATWSYEWHMPMGNVIGSDKTLLVDTEGTYILFATNENGCTNSTSIDVLVADYLEPNISGEHICDQGMAQLDGGIGFGEYEWIYMDDNSVQGSTQVIDVFNPGFYIVNVTLDGCSGSDTIEVIQYNTPQVSGPHNIYVCNIDNGIGTVCLDLTTLLTGSTGTWDNVSGVGGPTMLDDLTDVCFEGLPVGFYDFLFTTNDAQDPPCMNITHLLTVEVGDCSCPNIDVQDPIPACNALDTIFLDAESKVTNESGFWTAISGPIGQDLTSIIINNNEFITTGIESGDYSILFELDSPVDGCDSTNMISVTVYGQPIIVVEENIIACNKAGSSNPEMLNLDDYVSGATGTWTISTNPDGLSLSGNMIDFTGVTPATYVFTYMSNEALPPCQDVSDDLTVVVEDCNCLSVETSAFEDLCNEGGSHNLADHVITSEPGVWSIDPLTVDISGNVFDALDAEPGIYTLTYTINNQLPNCPEFSIQTITVLEPKFAGIPEDTTLCISDFATVNLIDLLDSPDTGGDWTSIVTTGFDNVDGTFDLTGQTAGSYSFTYSFENTFPCPQTSANVIVNIEDLPIADAGENKSLDCANPTAELDGSQSSGGGSFSYQWLGPNGDPIGGATSTSYTATAEGIYTIEVTSTITGCINTAMVEVTSSDDKPDYQYEAINPLCAGDANGSITIFNVSGGDGEYQYKIDNGTYGSSLLFDNLSSGDYTLFVIDGKGCETPVPVSLVNPDQINISITPGSHIAEIGDMEDLSFSTNADLTTSVVIWTENGEEICNTGSAEICDPVGIEINQTSTYCVSITDQFGCSSEDCIQISTTKVNDVYIPTVFNPELPGDLSHFYISDDLGIANITRFRIYSRWGELIFETENIKPNAPNYKDGWDGKHKGKYVQPGVYVYLIEVLYHDFTQEEFVGDVTVVR